MAHHELEVNETLRLILSEDARNITVELLQTTRKIERGDTLTLIDNHDGADRSFWVSTTTKFDDTTFIHLSDKPLIV